MTAGGQCDVFAPGIEYRLADGATVARVADRVALGSLFDAVPWRTFRWYSGQCHYSGVYWAATECAHVIYESRLELSELLLADFDPGVSRIKAQPFLLTALVNSRVRRHVPDYLLRTECGPVLVDVVREERLTLPKVATLCAWTRRVAEWLSWEYRVVCEPPAVLLGNVRFLAGYRRERLINSDALAHVRSHRADLVGLRIDDAERQLARRIPLPYVRSALMHTLWRQELRVDLTRQLRPSTVLEAA